MGESTPKHRCGDCGAAIKTPTATRCKSCASRRAMLNKFPPRPCKTCGQPMLKRNRTRAVYCNKACKFKDPELRSRMHPPLNRISKTCPACGKTFAVAVSMSGRYTHCSRACSRSRGRDETCARCGRAFRRSQHETRRHCSEECRRPPVHITCLHCQRKFRTTPSEATVRRYCSVECYRASNAETTIESIVRRNLDDYGVAYQPQAKVGRWTADFLIGQRIAVEADGDYWHRLRPDVDRRKNRDLTRRGLSVWRITEAEIVSPAFPAVIRRRLDAYQVFAGPLPPADLLQLLQPARQMSTGATHLGRQPNGRPCGERNHRAVLSAQQVAEIRRSNEPSTRLAARYGVGRSTIYNILTGKTWAHVPGPVRQPKVNRLPLSPEDVATIRSSAERGRDLAERYGVAPQVICRIRRGHLWAKPRLR
ncbi:DUF559 domain-containing protein [Micromonospora sp. NPDC006766]|uniref:DUF559 domain-containing protein n=1 Tax=Micromonospora sp. NPDC006766 TaxID=3154778 RepID=UPI0033D8D8B2